MRVIAGTHGGRRLRAPDTDETRPVADRVKESIFSSLGSRVSGGVVADLYAGAGSFGIEALSRGAETVVFVERGRKALDALRVNLSALGLSASVVAGTVESHLATTADIYDLVFCDPPWPMPSAELAAILEALVDRLGPGGLVVVTRHSKDEVPSPVGYRIDDERRMGDTRIIRYAKMDTT